MPNYRNIIISELELIRKKEQQSKNRFKVIAYNKVLPELKNLQTIESIDDIKHITGIGAGILKKITEIIETNHLQAVDEIRNDPTINIIEDFMNVYGIGNVKATKLVNIDKITSIQQLRDASDKDPKLLNSNQKKGLMYYNDFLQRIPHKEMVLHEKFLKKSLKSYDIEIVGSYRREEESSGDIDILVKCPVGQNMYMKDLIKHLPQTYILDTLAIGEKKFMGVCKIGTISRRIDILITPEEEYAFAIMYFTGSAKFNIGVRKIAQKRGLRMNEHGFKPNEDIPILKTESDIFDYLNIIYVLPKDRKDIKNITLKK